MPVPYSVFKQAVWTGRGGIMNRVLERCVPFPPLLSAICSLNLDWLTNYRKTLVWIFLLPDRERGRKSSFDVGSVVKKKRHGRIKIKYVVEAFVPNMTTTVTAVDTVCPLPEVVSTVIPFLDLNHARGFNYSPRYRCLKSQSPLCAMSKTRPTILFIRMSNFILAKFSFRTLILVCVWERERERDCGCLFSSRIWPRMEHSIETAWLN